MKLNYEVEEEEIKKVLAYYFKVPIENIKFKNRVITEGYGVNEHLTLKMVAELISDRPLSENVLP